MKPAFDIHIHTEHHIVVTRGPIFIQVRNGPLTVAVLDRMEQTLRLWRARQSKAIGVIIILEAGAAPATGPIRDRQAAVVQTAMSGDRAYLATVLMASGVILSLQRVVSRGISKSNPKIYMAASVPDATRWITKAVIELDERELRVLVEEVRAMLREGEPLMPPSTRRRFD